MSAFWASVGSRLFSSCMTRIVAQRSITCIALSPAQVAARVAQDRCINLRHDRDEIYRWEFDKGKRSLTVAVSGPRLASDDPQRGLCETGDLLNDAAGALR